jgi:hypothetical protein
MTGHSYAERTGDSSGRPQYRLLGQVRPLLIDVADEGVIASLQDATR